MLLLTPMARYQPTRPSRVAARCSSDEACAPNMTPAKSTVPWKKPESTWPLASRPSSLAAPSAAALHSFRRSGAWGVRSALRALQTVAGLRSDCRRPRASIVRLPHEPQGGRFVRNESVKPSREGLRAAGAPPCAPQAKILGDKPSRERFGAETLPGGFWGGNPPGSVLGRKPSRERFGAETLPGAFWG